MNAASDEKSSANPAREAGTAPPFQVGESWLFRNLPLRLVVPVALTAVAASLVAVAIHAPWWAAVIAALVPVLITMAPVRRRPAALLLGEKLAFWWRARRGGGIRTAAIIDAPLPEGGSYGLQWDGTVLTTMLRIDTPPDALTWLRRGSLSTEHILPLTEIADCIRQFDVELDSVDVISTGTRTASPEAVSTGYAASVRTLARSYDEIVGPLPAMAHRTVWVVLRLNPLTNVEAVGNRGGGEEGILRAATTATRRVANRLAARGITASVLTSSEITGAIRELTRGIPIDEFTEHSLSVEHERVHLTTFEIDSTLITQRGLAKIWAVPSLATTLTVRLRPTGDRHTPRGTRDNDAPVEVQARVRYDLPWEMAEPPVAGLQPLPRRQMWALLDSLPGSRVTRAAGYQGPISALEGLAIPTAGCGQLIGADEQGSGVAVPLIGSGSRRIEIVGGLMLAQQVILRAIALGAGAVVHTNRPRAWQQMVANIGVPQALSLASSLTQTARHNIAHLKGPQPSATLIVFDGVPVVTPPGSATVLVLRHTITPDWQPTADVTIFQHPNANQMITVRTPAAQATARMVTTPTEQQLLAG